MKNIKYILIFTLSMALMTSCQEDDLTFGDIITPSNVVITYEIVGADADNPNGDGSGEVIFHVTATNAISYMFLKDGTVSSAEGGTKSFNFVSTTGPEGTFDITTASVTAIASGTGGVSSSASVTLDVLAPNVPQPVVIEDFEVNQPELGNFGGCTAEYASNPDPSGINLSSTVIEHQKLSGSETWAGIFFDSDNINMISYKKVALKIWSPASGTPILLKFETSAGGGGPISEVEVLTNNSGAWEEIVFDFADIADEEWVRIVIFCDWDTSGNDSFYYLDDIKLLN